MFTSLSCLLPHRKHKKYSYSLNHKTEKKKEKNNEKIEFDALKIMPAYKGNKYWCN